MPPTGQEWQSIKEQIADKHVLAARVCEATALRIGELGKLTWGDVDFASRRFRVSVHLDEGADRRPALAPGAR